MKRPGVLILCAGMMFDAGGCCTAYKAAVERYTSSLKDRGKVYYASLDPVLKKEFVLNDAALVCLVDKDQDHGNSDACTCTDGLPDHWETNCAAWLK